MGRSVFCGGAVRRRFLLVGLLAVSACGASGAGATAGTGAWACAGGAPDTTVVHQYTHAPAQVGSEYLPSGGTALLCGSPGYGFRHILSRHQGDWQHTGSGDWSMLADDAVAVALGQPERVGYRASNGTFCYSHALPDGEVTTVVIRPSDGAIITAYPGTHQCDQGATAGDG
jgi:hypothetical protein